MTKNQTNKSGVRWVNLIDPTAEAINELQSEFGFSPQDARDCLVQGQRPKLVRHHDYIFMVLQFPVYHHDTREIMPSEVDFLIGQDFVITIHNNELSSVNQQFLQFDQGEMHAENSSALAGIVLDRLLGGIFPMLDHVSKDIRAVDRSIFHGLERKMVQEILILRRNMTEFKKIMQAHKRTIQRMIEAADDLGWLKNNDLATVLNQLIESTKDVWSNLETYDETIQALQETNESLISFRLNDIMKNYTTISVVIFTMTLTTMILAAETSGNPLFGYKYAFVILLAGVALTGFGMVQYFRQKHWL